MSGNLQRLTGTMKSNGAHREHHYLRGSGEMGVSAHEPESARLEQQQPRTQRVPRCVLLALTTLGVAQVASTLGLLFYFRTQQEMGLGRMSEESKHPNCLKSLLNPEESSHMQDTVEGDNERHSFCSELKEIFRGAVEKSAEKKKNNNVASAEVERILKEKESSSEKVVEDDSPVSRKSKHAKWPLAHLTINLSNSTWGPEKRVNLTSWNYKEGWANISNMTYHHGKLKVNQDGFYYVYANICFRHHETSANGNILDNGLQLMLYIFKSNIKRKSSETLMKGGSTKYWSTNSPYHLYSVYQGGIFKLTAGDEIFIEVSNPSLLDPQQDATYYGAFRIPDMGS